MQRGTARPGLLPHRGLDLSALAACALAPACLSALHVANVADAAHDAGLARALGVEAQPLGALDPALGALLSWLPLGTLSARAALGEALVAGAAGALLYALARRLLAACADVRWFGVGVSAIAAMCAALSAPWLLETSSPGGSGLGALLALAPLALLAGADEADARPPFALAALVAGLALGQDALAGLCGVAGCGALVALGPAARRRLAAEARTGWRMLVACALAGLLPALVALARTRALHGAPLEALSDWAEGERATSLPGAPGPFAQRELGTVLTVLAIGGAVLALVTPRARPLGAGLAVAAAGGLAAGLLGAPLGPTRFGAPVLAAMGAACVLAGASMQALVRVIAQSRLPLSRASAAMVLVLELVAPVEAADDALRRCAGRTHGSGALPEEPAAAWDDAAWGTLPLRSVVLVDDARIWRRAQAARAAGSLRGDLTVVPTIARGARAARVLSLDAALVPLWRDLSLVGAPSEETLSALAAARPLITTYQAAWGRALGKHLVAAGLFDRFEPEPRGTSDRRRALEAQGTLRDRLARAVVRDAELSDASARLLRQRLLDLAASGDRDLIGRGVEDLHAFAPDDPVAAAIVARTVLGKRPL